MREKSKLSLIKKTWPSPPKLMQKLSIHYDGHIVKVNSWITGYLGIWISIHPSKVRFAKFF